MSMRRSRARSDGLRLTKVGLWFAIFAAVALAAAINTGNNGLYLVVALMAGGLGVGQVLASANLRGLAVELEPPLEVFANTPARFALRLAHRGRWLPRWLLVVSVEREDVDEEPRRRATAFLQPYLPAKGRVDGELELILSRRGRRRIRRARVTSLFPFGFFRKGRRHPVEVDVLVYPELFAAPGALPVPTGRMGEEAAARAGAGHDLFALRPFRTGDDPRGVHWKQSARTGGIVFKERRAEENRRLSIVLDNAVPPLDEADRSRFERLVSEAATAAVVFLERGFEVEVVTRDRQTPFAAGRRQRRAVLEHLALVEPVEPQAEPLAPAPPGTPQLRLAFDPRGIAA